MALNLQHQTLVQLAGRLRAAYLVASGPRAAKIAAFIIDHIAAGDFTDVQVRNAFGLTAGQYTTLKAKFQTLRDDWLVVQAAQGE